MDKNRISMVSTLATQLEAIQKENAKLKQLIKAYQAVPMGEGE